MSRINPLDNLDEFQAKTTDERLKYDRESIAKIAEENGFPSRQAKTKPALERSRPHYFRTGRNQQINIKGTAACDAHLRRLAEEIGVPKGVILEEALNALESIKQDVIERLDKEQPNRRIIG